MRSAEEIRSILRTNLGYLERSAAAYDEGHLDEAIRIAVTVRTLIHDLKGDSLLTQLGVRGQIRLLATGTPYNPAMLVCMNGGLSSTRIIMVTGEPAVTRQEPNLGSAPEKHRFLPVEEWWTEHYQPMLAVSRRDLVLDASNRDGGTHVGNLRPGYATLKNGVVTVFQDDGQGNRRTWTVGDQHLADLRQVGYELLNSPELIGAAK